MITIQLCDDMNKDYEAIKDAKRLGFTDEEIQKMYDRQKKKRGLKMKNKYNVPWHIRQFVKAELMEYKNNKRILEKYTGDTRTLLIAHTRINQIETVFTNLNKEDREAGEAIFIDKYTQSGAEVAKGLSKSAYYNAMNKIIYLTAKEMGLI
jgi:hypothetical protein